MKFFTRSIPIIALGSILYLLGPAPEDPNLKAELPNISSNLLELEKQIINKESKIRNIKPDNQARIVWQDSTQKRKTPYSIVYLHGFSASQEEGNPVHRNFAKKYGCNLYLARLHGHGVKDKEPMLNVTPKTLMESAKEAVAIGKKLGDKVILMSTSTGGTLSLFIASNNPGIEALILYSPNIDLYDRNSVILDKHWGLQIVRLVMDGNYLKDTKSTTPAEYWTKGYRLEALISLRSLVDATMVEECFKKVKAPVFLGYYFKNEEEQDKVVSVPAMLEMYEALGTPDNLKRKVAFPNVKHHCIGNRFQSKDIKSVEEATFKFAKEVLNMKEVKGTNN